jgi:hypothetical protein
VVNPFREENMRKLVLNSDAVQVESFVPMHALGEFARGTVRANDETEGDTCSMMGSCPTHDGSCSQLRGDTCSDAGSCSTSDETCGATCSMMGSCRIA